MDNIKLEELKKHKTKRHALLRFLALIVVLIAYFFWMMHRFGSKGGIEITLLTWSFFVFCTPIADAGFLVAFPMRLITGVRMFTSQIYVFFIAFFLDIYFFVFERAVFSKTLFLQIFQKIIINPFPYWIIVILSLLGTFFSIYFGDELVDAARHKERKKYHKHKLKHRSIIVVFLFVVTILLYQRLIRGLGLNISL